MGDCGIPDDGRTPIGKPRKGDAGRDRIKPAIPKLGTLLKHMEEKVRRASWHTLDRNADGVRRVAAAEKGLTFPINAIQLRYHRSSTRQLVSPSLLGQQVFNIDAMHAKVLTNVWNLGGIRFQLLFSYDAPA